MKKNQNSIEELFFKIYTVFLSILLVTSAPRYSFSLKSAPHLSYFSNSLDNVVFEGFSSGLRIKYDIKLPHI